MDWRRSLADYIRYRYPKYTIDDLTPTESKGYFKLKKPCPGGKECQHAFRAVMGPCSGGGDLTIHVAEYGLRKNGKFTSPYRIWLAAKEEADARDMADFENQSGRI